MWRFVNDLAFRLRMIVRRADADRELEEELAHHRAMEAAERRAAGASAADAERAARARLGSDVGNREAARDGWGISAFH